MKILGIETSCDETATAVVEKKNGKFRLLGSAVASSEEIHKKYGGIFPEHAAREQLKAILPMAEEALKQIHPRGARGGGIPSHTREEHPGSGRRPKAHPRGEICRHLGGGSGSGFDFDAIAVTQGPGLIGSLIVGIEVAKTLSFVLKKPIIPINHLLAHLYINFLNNEAIKQWSNRTMFPSIGLIVSGGHTDLLLFKSFNDYKWLGGTRDDAAGECFDKCARLLDLGYPGGPEIEAAASKLKVKSQKLKVKLPRPMLKSNNFDFSFSGLKTAVLRRVQAASRQPPAASQLAWEIQEAITDILVEKTIRAAKKYKVKSILTGGGVIANKRLRRKLQVTCDKLQVKLFLPEKKLCTDNAVGIAIGGFFGKEVSWKNLRPKPSLEF